ncbi:MAG: S41 family peptidase [Clostridia bacterium]|nr:S41 family peptidase [Clostridia bacterium]
MKKTVSLPVFLLAIFIAALVTFQCTFIAVSESYEDQIAEAQQAALAYEKLDSLRSVVSEYYLFSDEVDEGELADFMAEMYLYYYVGDIYAAYYTAEEFEQYLYEAEGNLVGIGVSVVYDELEKTIEILYAMDGSPAKAAGLEPGDKIVAIGDDLVIDLEYEEAVNKIRGDVGTEVTVTIARTDLTGTVTEFTVTMTRAEVENQSVLYSTAEVDDSIAIIRILQFDGGTPTQFAAALERVKTEGKEKIIFDVRANPGGAVDSVASVLEMVIKTGTIATLYDAKGNVLDRWEATNASSYVDLPMVVLADQNTASAGELFTQSLQDYELATVIGTQTYGKGVGQSAFPLADGSWIYLTALYYDPPKSDNYHGVGVTPDVVVELPEQYQLVNVMKVPQSEDTQLAAAIAALNGEN